MELNSYQSRLLKDIESSIQAAQNMMEREPDKAVEFMARLPAIRTQLHQATIWASELYGAMSQERVEALGKKQS